MKCIVFSVVSTLLLAVSVSASAQGLPTPAATGGDVPEEDAIATLIDRRQFSLAAVFGVGSKYSVEGNHFPDEFYFGADVGVDFPILDWLLVGPLLSVRGLNVPANDDAFVPAERLEAAWFNIGGSLRLRLPLELNRVLAEPYLMVAPSLSLARARAILNDNFAAGWAISLRLGLRLLLKRRTGFLLEGGWEQARANFSDGTARIRGGLLTAGPIFAF